MPPTRGGPSGPILYVSSHDEVLDGDGLERFSKTPSNISQEVPPEELAKMAISYAREMEQLV